MSLIGWFLIGCACAYLLEMRRSRAVEDDDDE